MKDKIEIQLSKTKIFLLIIGSAIFVLFGVLFILYPENFTSPLFKNPEIIKISGMVSVAFFGLCIIFLARKLLDKKVGLIIDAKGITDNSNATSVGLIEWEDITGTRTLQVMSTKILIIDTNKPEKYIERAKSRVSKQAMKANFNMCGSPLSIISNSLKIKYDDLEALINNEFEKRKK